MALSDVQIRNAKPKDKLYRIKDERGLYLEVAPTGSKLWRFRYSRAGRETMLSLGPYPAISLREARDKRDELRKQQANGLDPSQKRKEESIQSAADVETFEAVAREWHTRFSATWTGGYAGDSIRRLEQNLFPWIGSRPIREVTPQELLATLRRIESRGALETAHRVLGLASQVFRYALATGKVERNPATDLRGALPPVKERHHASVTNPKEVAELLRAIDSYRGGLVASCALRLAALVFVRPGELRHAEWTEINFEKAEWRIPAAKMKMREQHIVPLARQALAILKEVFPLTGSGRYVFPSERTAVRPMSENTVNAALRRLGYSKEQMTGHGFRSMASTLLNEQGWNRDAVERQLAHGERNAVRAAYNFAEYLPERRKMMQAWADYLDNLKAGAKISPLRHQY